MNRCALILTGVLLTSAAIFAQQPAPAPPQSAPQQAAPPQAAPGPEYTPKYKGDPARSDDEFDALAYMRVVIRAEKQFDKQYGHYALNLHQLVHSGNFTRRMLDTDRGNYTVSYKGKKDGYILTLTPKMIDATHRSFNANEDGKIRGEESKPADENSPLVR